MTDKKEKVPSESQKEDKTNNEGAESTDKLTGGKFKTTEDLAKAYKELETKLGEQSDEIRQSREFMSVAQPVFDVIKGDEKLFEAIDKKLQGTSNNSEKDDAKDKTTNQEEVKETQRQLLMSAFESKHNFSKLSADEQKQLRRAIGNEIFELTGKDYNGIDLRRLSPVLEKAYTLAKSGITDKSTQEAIAEAEKTDDGAISSLPSSGGKAGQALTSEEAKVAERLGLTREQYVSGKK